MQAWGSPSPGQPLPLTALLLPASSSPPFVLSQAKTWWGWARPGGEEASIFPGACFWTCGFAGGQITFQVRPPDAAGKQPPTGRRAIFSPLSRMCPGASFRVAPQRATGLSLGTGAPSPAATVGPAPSRSPDLAQPIAFSPDPEEPRLRSRLWRSHQRLACLLCRGHRCLGRELGGLPAAAAVLVPGCPRHLGALGSGQLLPDAPPWGGLLAPEGAEASRQPLVLDLWLQLGHLVGHGGCQLALSTALLAPNLVL